MQCVYHPLPWINLFLFTFFLNFLHLCRRLRRWQMSGMSRTRYDIILFVIDIHHIMLISLFPTPFDHFHFHPTLGLDPALILTLRRKYCQIFIWGQILQNKHFQLTAKLGQWAAWSWNVTQIVMSAFKCAKNISLNFILKCVIIIQDLSSHENSLV